MNELVKIENNEITVNNEVIEKIKEFNKLKLAIELKEKELKENLKKAMEEVGLKKFSTNGFNATIKNPTTRTSLDTKKLKEELPDIYEEYSKISEVAGSIVLSYDE